MRLTRTDSQQLIDGRRAVSQYAAWPSLIGAEMVVNGDCSSGTGWTFNGVGGSITGGKMQLVAYSDIVENSGIPFSALVAGATYRNVFTIDSRVAGSVYIDIDGNLGTVRSAAGTFSEDIVNVFNDINTWNLVGTSATMQLDNFSVKSEGLNGVPGDWAFTGTASFDASGAILFTGSAGTAALTGSAATAFDAAVSVSTACSVTLTSQSDTLVGDISVSLREGTPVVFSFGGSTGEQVTHTVTSGVGSGYAMNNGAGVGEGGVARIQCPLA